LENSGEKFQGGEKGKNVFDIDIVALSEEGTMLLMESKWQDLRLREAREILNELKQKAEYIQYSCKRREFGLIAKRIEGKEKLKEEGYFAFDLADLERTF
jgi:uncharacterized Ntn-hydrolase superfamily protein